MKMNEQIRDKGFSSYEEAFIAENGQEAWDERQAGLQAQKEAKGSQSLLVVGGIFAALVAYKLSLGGPI